jgi:crotonobetainyl-CoA:carnitine CoA-transferase CaiB-like acyl-CoA transferase
MPLSDVTVLDLSRLLPGPYATFLLAEMGARVIKVEGPPPGDYLRYAPPHVWGMNAAFATLHRNKLSLVARLDTPEGAGVVRDLAGRCQVLVESFRPGVLARVGLDYESLRATNPGLIYCSLSGYGQSGPYAGRACHDIDLLALTGLAGALADRQGAPVVPGLQLADLTGGMMAALAILGALHEQGRRGQGRHLDISLYESAASLLLCQAAGHMATGTSGDPAGGLLSGRAPAYRYYRCRDGRWLALGALEPKFRERLARALGRPEGAEALLDVESDQTHRELEEIFARRTRDEWAALLGPLDACAEPVLDLGEALEHPHYLARGGRLEALAPDGSRVPQPAGPLAASFPRPETRLAPPAGLHTRLLLEELGYPPERIAALEAEGHVAGAGAEAEEAWARAMGRS